MRSRKDLGGLEKLVVLAALTGFMVYSGTALSFDVEVGVLTDAETHFLQYEENVSTVQNLSLVAQNTGSIGCEYRLKGEFSYRNTTQVRYSQPYPLWPSESTNVDLYFVPENFTGEVEASLYSTYCEQQKFVDNFTFESFRKNTVNSTIESKTVELSDESATVELPVREGRLVPKDTPPYWKTSSSKIVNGSSTLHYDPPIYNSDEKLVYSVVRNGELVGTTRIKLEETVSYWEKLEKRAPKILFILLGFSVVLNSRLLLERKGVLEKVREKMDGFNRLKMEE